MNLRTLLVAATLLAATGWWYSPASPRVPAYAAAAPGISIHCPQPPLTPRGGEPLQTRAQGLPPFRLAAADLQPLAGFSIDARVLSRKDYSLGREAELSPTDLALGWGRMREDAVLQQLDISQSSRWYRYRWDGHPPLTPAEIGLSSANMHMIPADATVAKTLRGVRKGETVRINGWLVEARSPDGWRWRSSTSREDTGGGACEVVYVCTITRQQ